MEDHIHWIIDDLAGGGNFEKEIDQITRLEIHKF